MSTTVTRLAPDFKENEGIRLSAGNEIVSFVLTSLFHNTGTRWKTNMILNWTDTVKNDTISGALVRSLTSKKGQLHDNESSLLSTMYRDLNN